jgi:pilus assembly protein CpaC
MHRTYPLRALAIGTLLAGIALQGQVQAQQAPPAPAGQAAPAPGVARQLIIPIGGSQRIAMTTGKRIARVLNSRPNVARVTEIPNDPFGVLLTGVEAGITQLTLTDENGAQERVDIIIQLDVEYLRTVLTRAVPTANVVPIPAPNGTIVLSGTVAHTDDIDVILKAAAAVAGGPDRVVNQMHVAGVVQIQLDVVVAEVSREKFRRMAFSFINQGAHHFLESATGGALATQTTTIVPPVVNFVGTPNGANPNLFLHLTDNEQSFLGVLQALKDETIVKFIAEPKLVALSGKPGSFLSGGEQAVPIPAGLGQVGVQFEEFGTRLNYLAIVMGNGKIHLEVEPEVSTLNATFGTSINGTVVPGRETQRVHTTVELEDGQTFVIGGLIQRRSVGNTSKVPVLGEIPFLGVLFSSKSYDEQEIELVVAVTPHLVDGMSCDQAPKIFPGQETRSPDDFELFLEGILEAPRGPRTVFAGCGYVAPHKNGPTASMYPCAGSADGFGVACGACGACGNKGVAGGCATCGMNSAQAPAAAVKPAVTTPAQAKVAPATASPTPTSLDLPAALPAEPNQTGGSGR